MAGLLVSMAAVALLSACAPMTQRVEVDQAAQKQEADFQRGLALEGFLADRKRLYRVSYPLLRSALEFCKDNTRNAMGIMYMNRWFLGDFSDIGPKYGYGNDLVLVTVVADSAAARAGLEEGAVIVSLNDIPSPTSVDEAKALNAKLGDLLKTGSAISMVIRAKDGNTKTVSIMPDKLCGYEVELNPDSRVNAFADGRKVIIPQGMMRFAASDQELALVVSHEISHNAMGHISAQQGNRLIGAILDGILAGATRTQSTGAFTNAMGQAFSQDFEAEADYVGLYIMAKAGMPITEAPKFWRRMGASNPGAISAASTHPATAYRMLALDKTVTEIHGKKSGGLPLAPQMRPQATAANSAPSQPTE